MTSTTDTQGAQPGANGGSTEPAMVQEEELAGLPRDVIPQQGTGTKVAYDLMTNELLLDGSARLNLATFVTTWMPPDAAQLMAETADKNMIDKDEYPQTAEFERRCVNMIGRLWHAPGDGDVTGCSTTGSSEAAMLGGLALKWLWRARMKAAGKPTDRPNLVLGINVQVCWDKFCRYWDVEPRLVPMEGDRFHLTAAEAVAHCDENTIGVVAILGSTFDGSYEPVAEICAALDELAANGGPDIPVHVDAASGGFVAPFSQPDLVWDFALPRVHSINASGHKYGLVYPGVGWAIWRDAAALPGISCSTSTTSADRCRRSRSTSPGPEARCWRSTSCSWPSAWTGTQRYSARPTGSRSTSPARLRRSAATGSSPTEASCRCWPSPPRQR